MGSLLTTFRPRRCSQPIGQQLHLLPSAERFEALALRIQDMLTRQASTPVAGLIGDTARVGTTTIALRLADSLGRSLDRPVLLIDANLENPLFRVDDDGRPAPGLIQVLAYEASVEECLLDSGIPQLTVLPSRGSTPSAAATIGNRRRFRELLDELRDLFSFIVVDLPPATEDSPGVLLSRSTDGVLLVVDAERSTVASTRQTAERLAALQSHVLGVVFNKRR